MSDKNIKLLTVVVLGAASTGLYWLMYQYNDNLLNIAQEVRNGDKSLFLFPILIAFIFSYVHGAFTGKFWDVLGFKAAGKK